MSEVFSIFMDVAPEFDSIDPRVIKRFISYAEPSVGSVFGKQRNLAIALLAAHMLSMADRQGSAGVIASEKEGELATSYHHAQYSGEISSTSYGQEFNRIARSLILCPMSLFGSG